MTMLLRFMIVFFTILLESTIGHAQLVNLEGTWITKDQDVLVIQDSAKGYSSISNKNLDVELLLFEQHSSIIRFIWYDGETDKIIENISLKILCISDTILVLSPINKMANKFFMQRKIIKFIKQNHAIDTTIIVEKIIFHVSFYPGKSPHFHYQIDSNRNIYFFGQQVNKFNNDSTLTGYFSGMLSSDEYQKLTLLLRTCNLRTLRYNNSLCCDGTTTTLIVYFNEGQRLYIRTMYPPLILNNLYNFLTELPKKANLPRTDKYEQIEN